MPRDAQVLSYWITVLQLLELGVPWKTATEELDEDEINYLLGVQSGIEEKRQKDNQSTQGS